MNFKQCGFSKKIIDFFQKAKKENKKILLVGNKPLYEKYGEIIDSYDIVIRFNLAYYKLENGELDKEIYGSKTDIIMAHVVDY